MGQRTKSSIPGVTDSGFAFLVSVRPLTFADFRQRFSVRGVHKEALVRSTSRRCLVRAETGPWRSRRPGRKGGGRKTSSSTLF
eukprot:6459839-Prorocentrum_lima.AAC.1